MSAGRCELQPVGLREVEDVAAQPDELLPRLLDAVADPAADLDLRLEKLGLDLVLEHDLALVQKLLHEGGELSALGIDDLVLLLDADRELR